MTMMPTHIALCGFLLLASSVGIGAGEAIAIKVYPTVSMAPSNLVVRASVQTDDSNRALEIYVESAEFYRSSMITLDGAKAPRTNVFEFRSMPGGEYDVTAVLVGPQGARATCHQRITVIASGETR